MPPSTRARLPPLPSAAKLTTALLSWFQTNARDLPWRRTRDPYAIWVSEIMLQQTQVATVIPYWDRWMKTFPTLNHLAEAPESFVLKQWEGLGYYSRARNLHRAAQQVVREHGGKVPMTAEILRELPGIGPYTAGAIASIAFNLPEPILDGNIIRVLTRLYAWKGDPKSRDLQIQLWAEARRLVQAASIEKRAVGTSPVCSFLNQGLMELGATVCTPTQPRCTQCPWKADCRSYAAGTPEAYPQIPPRVAIETRQFATAVVKNRESFLLRQRPAGQVNAGYWEFPNIELAKHQDPQTELATWLSIPADNLQRLTLLRHSITRYRMIQHIFQVEVRRKPRIPGARWATRAELVEMALTGPHRRLIDIIILKTGVATADKRG